MTGILIQYQYSGDETAWQDAVEAFVANIRGDERLKGRFHYEVVVHGDGTSRSHIGHWDNEETLSYLQGQEFFKRFAGQIKGFGGDTLDAKRFETKAAT